MQRILHITIFFILTLLLSSCGKLLSKKYVLKENVKVEKMVLQEIKNQKGIYALDYDSINNILSLKYYPEEFNVEDVLNILEDNDWLAEVRVASKDSRISKEELEELALDSTIYELTDSLNLEDSIEENIIPSNTLPDSLANPLN